MYRKLVLAIVKIKNIFLSSIISASMAASTQGALTFNFTKDTDTTVSDFNTIALPVFTAAGNRWSNLFNDNITVNISIGYSALGPGILGQAGSNQLAYTYTDIRNALNTDRKSTNDNIAYASLPAGPNIAQRINDLATGNAVLDNNNTTNNQYVVATSANAKALGLEDPQASALDAVIKFSNGYAWDTNPDDGITPGTFDLVGTATHEIGHALGFLSGADDYDYYSAPNGPSKGSYTNFDPFAVMTSLDLYRLSSASLALDPNARDVSFGGSPYLSIDGGVTNLGDLSTGSFNGDGWQASHWKNNLGLGIMNPTANIGTLLSISQQDATAIDVIGYDLIPEPTSVALLMVSCMILIRRRRTN